MAQHPDVVHYVFGHIHLARQLKLDESHTMTILGDWIEQFTYASFDGNEIELHTLD